MLVLKKGSLQQFLERVVPDTEGAPTLMKKYSLTSDFSDPTRSVCAHLFRLFCLAASTNRNSETFQ